MAGRYAILPLIGFFILVFSFFSLTANRFASATNIENLLSGFSFVAMLAVGQAFPILLRGIDLSVGAIMAVVGMVVFDLSLIFGFPGWLILPLALLVGAAAGALNGILVVYVRLQPFIATLATLAAYRGLVYSISGRQLVPELSTTPLRDPWIVGLETYFDIGRFLGISSIVKLPWIPLSFVALLALVAVLQFVLTATRFGRDLLAVGGNPEGARLAGIDVARVTIAGYAICGACAALAALFLVARLTTATEALGIGAELTAIAAAVVGGVSLQGGVGSVVGPAVGAFLLGLILLGLTLLGVSQFVQQIMTGVILLAAISYDRLLAMRVRRAGSGTAQ